MAKTKRLFLLLPRLAAFVATLTAVIVMATSREKAGVFGISFEAKYSHTPAFKYFLIVNAIASVYGFLILFLPSESLLWRFAIALDLVFTLLLSSGLSAALAIAYVGKEGNSYAGWLPICGQVPKYCDQIKGALVAGFIGVIIYMLLLLQAIHAFIDPFLLRNKN